MGRVVVKGFVVMCRKPAGPRGGSPRAKQLSRVFMVRAAAEEFMACAGRAPHDGTLSVEEKMAVEGGS